MGVERSADRSSADRYPAVVDSSDFVLVGCFIESCGVNNKFFLEVQF